MPFISSHLPFTYSLVATREQRQNRLNNNNEGDENDNDEISVPEMAAWKKYARIILPHVGLILLSFLYITGGALAFYHLESPNEVSVRADNLRRIQIQKEVMLEEMWELINSDTPQATIEEVAAEYVDNVTRILFEAFDTHYITDKHLRPGVKEEEYSWTFITALFFTATLLTTIGYGNLVPVTWQGRMFCIAYALFGVPLILITVADIGKFLSENIIWLYTRYSQARKRWHQKSSNVPLIEEPNNNNANKNDLMGGLEQYIAIPITLIVIILLGYIAIGAVLLGLWEDWDFFSGFYFSFITMTTVGFGDIVPLNREFYLFDLAYIIIGLAITTMCIDLVGIQYIRKIHYFGRAIQDARFALVNVGGKMVHVPDLMRYASVLQQKYGPKKPQEHVNVKGAYTPNEINLIKFIDYSSLCSAMASVESFQTFFSNMWNGNKHQAPVAV